MESNCEKDGVPVLVCLINVAERVRRREPVTVTENDNGAVLVPGSVGELVRGVGDDEFEKDNEGVVLDVKVSDDDLAAETELVLRLREAVGLPRVAVGFTVALRDTAWALWVAERVAYDDPDVLP